MTGPAPLPHVTHELPGIGGVLRSTVDDFRVEEIPAYEPVGEGDHVFCWIEKRELTTPEAAASLARIVGVSPGDVGWAGMKDRRAVTRQWLSFPSPCTPAQLTAASVDGVQVLDARRHRNKLRTGHLRGNRFTLTIRETDVDTDTAAARAGAILELLTRAPGAPNWFGAQRFGNDGTNAAVGAALVRGQSTPGRPPRGRRRRLFISAYQSSLFNEYLRRRIDDDLFRRVLAGDLLQKRESGGIFVSETPDVDQPRLDAEELAITGPMFGHKMKRPAPDSPSANREEQLLDQEKLALDDFKRVGKLAQGTRRPLSVGLGTVLVEPASERAITIHFELPSGSYATAIAREVVKGQRDFPR